MRALTAALASASLALVGCSDDSDAPPAKPVLAVIPKGTSHVFWKSIHAGARQAADELGYDIIWKGPLREDDRANQIKLTLGLLVLARSVATFLFLLAR